MTPHEAYKAALEAAAQEIASNPTLPLQYPAIVAAIRALPIPGFPPDPRHDALRSVRDCIREQYAEEAAPFLRVYRINEPISGDWAADKPLRDIIPGSWPTWGDLKRIATALRNPKDRPDAN